MCAARASFAPPPPPPIWKLWTRPWNQLILMLGVFIVYYLYWLLPPSLHEGNGRLALSMFSGVPLPLAIPTPPPPNLTTPLAFPFIHDQECQVVFKHLILGYKVQQTMQTNKFSRFTMWFTDTADILPRGYYVYTDYSCQYLAVAIFYGRMKINYVWVTWVGWCEDAVISEDVLWIYAFYSQPVEIS